MSRSGLIFPKAVMTLCVVLLSFSVVLAQDPGGPPPQTFDAQQQGAPLLSPDQLDNLVAPIALYPDPLLSQVLAASTYPLEIAEAQQWVQQNRNLQGAQLIDAAKQQNWDPSVQALVAFPDAFRLLSNDVRWTTDLGNAFLAQQADVMSAVQRMRARARQNGRLANTPQQVVTTDYQDGQGAIEIQPADPQVAYVPVYNPSYVWGPPAWGSYPDLYYPSGYGYGFGFGPGIYMGSFYPGWGGWGGWGWGCGWFGHGLFVNTGFFSRYGFHGGYYGGYNRGFGGRTAWSHDPGHRMGVGYSNRAVANRFDRGGMNRGGQFSGNRSQFNGNRSSGGQASPGGWQRFNGGSRPPSAGQSGARGFAPSNGFRGSQSGSRPSMNYGSGAGSQTYRGPSSNYQSAPSNRSVAPAYSGPRGQGFSAPRSYSAPTQNYSAPRSMAPAYSAPHGQGFSAPRSYSAPHQNYSAPRSFSAPHSSGGGSSSSGGHSGASGGHSSSSGEHSGRGDGRRR